MSHGFCLRSMVMSSKRHALVALAFTWVLECSGSSAELDLDLSTLKPNTFTIVTVPKETGATCGLGGDFEFFVRVPESGLNTKNLVLEFSGGGGCWDYVTCSTTNEGWGGRQSTEYWFSESMMTMAATLLGRTIKGCNIPFLPGSLWNFCRDDHPRKEWTWVSLSYCTGDQHLGNTTRTYTDGNGSTTVHHRGAINVDVVLRWIEANFPDLERINMMGASAGGWATFGWAHAVADRFPNADIMGWADSSLHLPCPSAECDRGLPAVDDAWDIMNPLVRPSWSTSWTPEAIRAGGWKMSDWLSETVNKYQGRVRFGVFTRSLDRSQLKFWDAFGGNVSEWTSKMTDMVHMMEQSMPPELFRTYIVNGSDHSINLAEEFWTLTYDDVPLVDWMTNLSHCDVSADTARIWDPLVGEPAKYSGPTFSMQCGSAVVTTTTAASTEQSKSPTTSSWANRLHSLHAALLAASCVFWRSLTL
eukprot:TRINITY_DN24603_c0_g1_i1.p1 TRINITY_DN24603_c0_g1~~TRINITY_DN24603_c0_g1_i1.p1  ORF type:complete len:474 (+),score=56.68 TRINITY_DN24603_c0_g1_i1:44-1465(+)